MKKKRSKNKIEKVSTGIKNLDELTKGGFKKETINLLIGSSGSGKSLLSLHFLLSGIKNDENCLYISFQEKKKDFYENANSIGIDLKKHEKEGKFTFLEHSPIKVRTMLEEGGGEIESIVRRKKISRLVVDSITSFEMLFEKEFEKRESILNLFSIIDDWKCTTLITFEGDPLKEEDLSETLEFESESIILLYYTMQKNKRKRHLEILKMRGTEHSKAIHEFTIGKKGISIKKTPAKNPPKIE